MNGPQHYRRAEQLLRQADGRRCMNNEVHYWLAAAQVHAQLAATAAAAEAMTEGSEWSNWHGVAYGLGSDR